MLNKSELLTRIRTLQKELDSLVDVVIAMEDVEPKHSEQINNVQSDNWMTAQEVCDCLKIGLSTLYRNIRAGVLPNGIKFSERAIRWRMSDIVAHQKRKTTETEECSNVPIKKRGRPSRVMKVGDFLHA